MKFIVYRTSNYYTDVETLEDLKIDLNKYNVSLESKKDYWGVKRKYAVIEINSLEELIELTKDYKQIILNSKNPCVDGMLDLEIYDDWRE